MKLLNYINEIKANVLNLKAAFRNLAKKKGIEIPSSIPFMKYPEMFEGIDSQGVPKDLKLSRILNVCPNITNLEVDENIFTSKLSESGDYTFRYNKDEDKWKLFNVDEVELEDWGINASIIPEVLEKTPQYTLIGSPTIENYIAKMFSNTDYIQVPDFTPELKTWKIHIKFRTSDDVNTKQCIWYVWEGDTMGFIYQGYLNLVITGVTSWNTTEYRLPLEPNTLYDGEWVFDGESYTLTLTKEDGTILTTTAIGTSNISDYMYLGSKRGSESFLGQIYLEHCWYDIEEIRIWEACSPFRAKFTTYGTPDITVNKGSNWSSSNYIKFNIPVYETVESAEVIIKADVGSSTSNYPQMLSFPTGVNTQDSHHIFGCNNQGQAQAYFDTNALITDIDLRNKTVWFKSVFKNGVNTMYVIVDNNYTLETLPTEGWYASSSHVFKGVDGSFISKTGEYSLGRNWADSYASQYWNSNIYLQTLQFTVNGEVLTNILFTSEPRSLSDGDKFTISVYDENSGWVPDPEWFDIKKIITEDEEYAPVKLIALYNNNTDIFSFKLSGWANSGYPYKIKTSDGFIYDIKTNSTKTVSHVWDKTKDKPYKNIGLRWVMFYLDFDKVNENNQDKYIKACDVSFFGDYINKQGLIYLVFDGTIKAWNRETLKASPYLEAIDILGNSKFYSWESSNNICNNCMSLKHIPNNPMKYIDYLHIGSYKGGGRGVNNCTHLLNIPLKDNTEITGKWYNTYPSKVRINTQDMSKLTNNYILSQNLNLKEVEGVIDLTDTSFEKIYIGEGRINLKHCKVILPSTASLITFCGGNQSTSYPDRADFCLDDDDESFIFLAKYAPVVTHKPQLEFSQHTYTRLRLCDKAVAYKGNIYTPYELLLEKGWVFKTSWMNEAW